MPIEHKDLTGDQVHEPKGADSATSGTVYTSDGAGSGDWVSPTATINNKNIYSLTSRMTNMENASSVYFYIPLKSRIRSYHITIYGAVDANTVMTPYINGVANSDTVTVTAAGSAAGQTTTKLITTSTDMAQGSQVRIASDGAATANIVADIQLVMEAIP